MSFKTILGVVIVAMLIGVLYVFFENNFMGGGSKTAGNVQTAQELGEPPGSLPKSTILNLPTPAPEGSPIDSSSDLLNEAQILELRDYSGYFEELKESVSQ